MRRTIIVSVFAISLLNCIPVSGISPDPTGSEHTASGWYLGAEGGVTTGFGTFSSFGYDGFRPGALGGIFAGYRFNDKFSAELDVRFGKDNLWARECCIGSNYYLGSDSRIYYASVLGMDCYKFSELKSVVSTKQFGVRFNVNLLGFFPRQSTRGWSLELSPILSLFGSRADIMTIPDGKTVIPATMTSTENSARNATKRHLGYGGVLTAAYRIGNSLRVGVSTGITRLTGTELDGIVHRGHRDNFVWETVARLSYDLPIRVHDSNGSDQCSLDDGFGMSDLPMTQPADVSIYSSRNLTIRAASASHRSNFTPMPISSPEPIQEMELRQPLPQGQDLFFAFDKWAVTPDQTRKLQQILEYLMSNDDAILTLNGWCDRYGSDAVNERISTLRAESVKTWLVARGVDSSRIEALGCGVDRSERNNTKARRVSAELHRIHPGIASAGEGISNVEN